MPRIPTLQGIESPTYPRIPVQPIRELGESVRRGIGQLTDVISGYEEMIVNEQKAQDTLELIKTENLWNEEERTLYDVYNKRNDPENFDNDIKKDLLSIYEKTKPKLKTREAQIAHERAFGNYSARIQGNIKTRQYNLMQENGQVEALKLKKKSIDKYANALDDKEREIIKNEYFTEMNVLRDNKLINKVWVQNQKDSYDVEAKAHSIALADVEADKIIENNLGMSELALQSSKNRLKDLPPKVFQDKIEKARVVDRMWKNEQEKKKKEVEKENHDKEDREIGNLFMNGEYSKAYLKAQASSWLSGDEKRNWANAIDQKTKEKKEEIDPFIEATEIIKINSLISKDADPQTIRKTILFSDINKQNKEQYLNKLEQKIDKEIDEARKLAYSEIQKLIVPKQEGISMIPKIVSPKANLSIMNAQMALDEWIDRRIKENKPPTKFEIREKSWTLAAEFQIPLAEAYLDLIESQKRQVEELRSIRKTK